MARQAERDRNARLRELRQMWWDWKLCRHMSHIDHCLKACSPDPHRCNQYEPPGSGRCEGCCEGCCAELWRRDRRTEIEMEAKEIKSGTLQPVKDPTDGWRYTPVHYGVADGPS